VREESRTCRQSNRARNRHFTDSYSLCQSQRSLRLSVRQSVLMSSLFRVSWSDISPVLKGRFLLSCVALSDETVGLSLVRNQSLSVIHIYTFTVSLCMYIITVFKLIQKYAVHTWPLSVQAWYYRTWVPYLALLYSILLSHLNGRMLDRRQV
jgi:hypothetical protein